jgi:hypothetical protein
MRGFIGVAAVVAACAGIAGDIGRAEARSIGGASAPSLVDCISRTAGTFGNNCGSTKGGLFSLPVQFTGTKNITVFGNPSGSVNGLSCQAVARASNGGVSQQTGFQSPPVPSGATSIVFPGINLVGNGYMYVQCNLATGASVTDIVYND